MKTDNQHKPNKMDAGNGSEAICRVSNVLRSPSPDPSRSPNYNHLTPMRSFIHWLLIAVIAVLMARLGFYLMDSFGPSSNLADWHYTKWIALCMTVPIATWTIIWFFARRHSWPLWAILGLLSPVIGSLLVFPATPLDLGFAIEHYRIVFPIGLATGLLSSLVSALFRPHIQSTP